MSAVMQRESTNYVYFGNKGTVPNTAELAFLAAGDRPASNGSDWQDALILDDDSDPGGGLRAEASIAGVSGDYLVAILVGPFGDAGVTLTAPADWQCWGRLTGDVEQKILIYPTVLEMQ